MNVTQFNYLEALGFFSTQLKIVTQDLKTVININKVAYKIFKINYRGLGFLLYPLAYGKALCGISLAQLVNLLAHNRGDKNMIYPDALAWLITDFFFLTECFSLNYHYYFK